MFKNYFKTAWRNLFRNKGFSVINIAGFAIGMASAILILLWIQNEISYDRFYVHTSRLYKVFSNTVVNNSVNTIERTPEIMAPNLKNEVPGIEAASRFGTQQYHILNVRDKSLKPKGAIVDANFLSIFGFPLSDGSVSTALNDPYSIVLSEQLAKKIFGNEDAMGKLVKFDNTDNLKVTGILKDLPNNTQFNFEYLISYEYRNSKAHIDSNWTHTSTNTFVLLKPNISFNAANNKIKKLIGEHTDGDTKISAFLYPISKLRLYSNFHNGVAVGGRIERVKVFLIIAVFILCIACINFMNLSTARSEKRAKEVGVRKVIGAEKKSLVLQFLGESILISFIAGVIAILLVQLCLPAYNRVIQQLLFIDYGSIYFWLSLVGFILLTGILAGGYPAFFLSSFKPVLVLKGTFKKVNALVTPRKVLVVLQFTFAIGLIICTIVIQQQIKYAQSRETGYDSNNLGYVFMQGDIDKNYALIKSELVQSGAATSVLKAQAPLTQNWNTRNNMSWQGKVPNVKVEINCYTEDGGLVKTAGMQLLQGRDIDVQNYASDSTACLINESAMKMMGFKNPVGQIIQDDTIQWHVIGVIKDFILESPYESVKPFMMRGPKFGGSILLVKLNTANGNIQALAKTQDVFKKYNPGYPFEFYFIDEEYAKKFSDEQLTGTLASFFAMLTIFISCLGLFGLATYIAESRVKEIGIRKVLGASVISITALLSKDFIKLVALSFVIASPIAWLVMHQWLLNYEYRISVGVWIFVTAGVIAVFIALMSVSFQSIKAAMTNPVKSLRAE
jgi:putative ABC transport system permease protein